MAKSFLDAEWRKLLMFNYAVDPALLQPYVPNHTELDFWQGACYVSLVGFMFVNTRLKGFRVPFHANFEEVNLRFYVRYKEGNEWKRGVVFIKEIVPKPALTFVARIIYDEHYETLPMRHSWQTTNKELTVTYAWKRGSWHTMQAVTETATVPIEEGSEAEFITEHYWGYTKSGGDKTSEYGVEHPRWEVHPVIDYTLDVDFVKVYGQNFGFLKDLKPTSVFLAEGSEIAVKGKRLLLG